ncbi:MAG: ABC transporter ATP-binding protein [Clostridium sp.]
MPKPIIEIKNVAMLFDTSVKTETYHVLENINIDIEKNEFVCLIGPSGCGKSTLLRVIAGLQASTGGEVLFDGEKHTKPGNHIGMVFQNYSLMPWLTTEDNIRLGLDFKRISKKEKDEIVSQYLDLINMKSFAKSMPHELSGGMQQRVAIARTLAADPEVVLMDEPFGALDAYTRILLQKELLNIWEKDKKTIIFVTHSVDEAIYLADRIILMSKDKGKIVKEIKIDMPRPRERSDRRYGKITEELLSLLETVNQESERDS